MDIDEVETAKTREPLAELARPEEPSGNAAAAEGASAEPPAADADEPVSDTDDDDDGELVHLANLQLGSLCHSATMPCLLWLESAPKTVMPYCYHSFSCINLLQSVEPGTHQAVHQILAQLLLHKSCTAP